MLIIPGMTTLFWVERNGIGLKPKVRLEVRNSVKYTFEESATVALNSYSSLYGIRIFHGNNQKGFRGFEK